MLFKFTAVLKQGSFGPIFHRTSYYKSLCIKDPNSSYITTKAVTAYLSRLKRSPHDEIRVYLDKSGKHLKCDIYHNHGWNMICLITVLSPNSCLYYNMGIRGYST